MKELRCPRCTYAGPATSLGLCPKCGFRIGEALAPLRALPVRPEARSLHDLEQRRMVAGMALGLLGGLISVGNHGLDFTQAQPMLVGLMLFGALAAWAWFTQRDRQFLERCQLRPVELHGHAGFRVEVGVAADYLDRGDRLEVSVTLRTPRGDLLRGRRPPFQEVDGTFRAA